MYNMTKEQRRELGRKGRQHVESNYNFETYSKNWDELLTSVHENLGSWDTRKNYQSWKLMEL